MNRYIEVNSTICECLQTLPNEKVLIAKRQHPLVLLLPIIVTLLISSFLIAVGSYGIIRINSPPLLFAYILLIGTLAIASLLKIIIDWFLHLYIVTDRKILEIQYIPFFKDKIASIFLDQVRVTEVDTKITSFIHELFDMGDVTIGFDRPSHEELCMFLNIKNPRETGTLLANFLEGLMRPGMVWFEHTGQDNGVKNMQQISKFTEDIYTKYA